VATLIQGEKLNIHLPDHSRCEEVVVYLNHKYIVVEEVIQLFINRMHDEPIFINADSLVGVQLNNSDFHRCLLSRVDMTRAYLINCDFRSAELNESKFDFAEMDEAKLIMVDAKGSSFQQTSLRHALLLHSDFEGANFAGAILSNVILKNSKFIACNFCGAIMDYLELEDCDFTNSFYDSKTIWKDGFTPEEYGLKKVTK
jgi:uncharacterized protein YjbI with pentapeptide repeats